MALLRRETRPVGRPVRAVVVGRSHNDDVPLDLPGCVFWADADIGVSLDGSGNALHWSDRSPARSHGDQATAGSRPALQQAAVNGRRALHFDGTDDRFSTPLTFGTTATVVTVATSTQTGAVSSTPVSLRHSTGNGVQLQLNWTTVQKLQVFCRDDAGTSAVALSSAAFANEWLLFSGLRNGGTVECYRNGSQLATASAAVGTTTVDTTTFIGSAPGGSYLKGSIAALAIYRVALSPGQRGRLERWLGSRYGISVS